MAKAKAGTRYVVANPRGIPAGRYILHARVGDEDRYWFEGDDYDGPVTDRFVNERFIVPKEAN